MKKIFLGVFILSGVAARAQQDSTSHSLTISGYAEPYYVYDFNRPVNNTRPGFIYSHNRANEVNINLAYLKAAYATKQVRANLSVAAGTYMNTNLAAEPGVLKNIFEANAGIRLSKNKELWIDAGILSSHIGFESAVGKDNWTLTRSLCADNSPYYEAGVKLNYTSGNGKLYWALLYLNGWQRIQRPDGNTTPAGGLQLTYKPSAAVTFNYSNFIGNDKPDSVSQLRHFHNFYGIFTLAKQFVLTAGFDMGFEQIAKGSGKMNTWYTPVLIIRYKPEARNAIVVRGEYYHDPNGVIVYTGTPQGFKTFGGSINYDHTINEHALWRIEFRHLSSKDDVFVKKDRSVTGSNSFISTAVCVNF